MIDPGTIAALIFFWVFTTLVLLSSGFVMVHSVLNMVYSVRIMNVFDGDDDPHDGFKELGAEGALRLLRDAPDVMTVRRYYASEHWQSVISFSLGGPVFFGTLALICLRAATA